MSNTHAEGGSSVNLDFKNARQNVPSPDPTNKADFGIGGFDTARVDANDMSNDDERPSPPVGEVKIGTDMNLAAVAPYKYGEFPKDSIHTGLKDPAHGG